MNRGALTTLIDRVPALLARGQPLRYLVAGGINTIFGLALYPLLLWSIAPLRHHYLVALGLAQAISLIFAFGVYRRGVFRSKANIVRQFGTFASFYLIVYAVNWAALPLLVEGAGVRPVVAQLGFSVLVIIGSWFWHTRLTFKPQDN